MDRSQVEEIVSRRLCDVETALPGYVQDTLENGNLLVVPLIKKVTVDGIVDVQNMALEARPFVIGNENLSIEIGFKKGDSVLLLGLSRHASEWLNSKSNDPVIPRTFQALTLNDLVAVPLCRGDRENGKSANIKLGVDGAIEISSFLGQRIKFVNDGSIEIVPKSGKEININGVVNGSDFKTGSVSFNGHIHT